MSDKDDVQSRGICCQLTHCVNNNCSFHLVVECGELAVTCALS